MNRVISRVLSEDVLDKAMELFWQKGFFNTSIDDITQISELNRATMYKYYGGKNKFFLAMLKRFRLTINDQATLPLQNIENGLQGIDEYTVLGNS